MPSWLSVDDRKTEGEWRDFYTERLMLNYTQPWIGSKPDGGQKENCAWLVGENSWADIGCNSHGVACMCTHKPYSSLEFKGLCPGTSIDVYFKPISGVVDSRKLIFQGLDDTLITYNNVERVWILNVADSNVTGISKATHVSFILGKHNWTIKGDKDCHGEESYVAELKMSGCQKGNFTCMLMPQNVREEEDDSEEKTCRICQMPQLKTLGDNPLIICKNSLEY